MERFQLFQKALPVWPKGRAEEVNLTCRFFTQIPQHQQAKLLVAASSLYRLFVNGSFAAYGPARGPKGYFRVDEIDLTPFLTQGANSLCIEVTGYNCNSFYLMNQPSFLLAEVTAGGQILAHTARAGRFACSVVTQRVQKVQRYSYQRPFTEVWRMDSGYEKALVFPPDTPEELEQQPEKRLLPRRVPMPDLTPVFPQRLTDSGQMFESKDPVRAFEDRSLTQISRWLTGFDRGELEVPLSDEANHFAFVPKDAPPQPVAFPLALPQNRFITLEFSQLEAGFLSLTVRCEEPVQLWAFFDERMDGQELNFYRLDCCNILRFDLQPGEHHLLSMECYTMKYLRLAARGGSCQITGACVREYAAPQKSILPSALPNSMRMLWNAAAKTWRQNSVDLPMDCPSRERAAWLCDSFFNARAERALTGQSLVEQSFLENYLLAEDFSPLPPGMVSMCYPSDHPNGQYIPNWAIWLVLQLEEYVGRTGDRQMAEAFRGRIYGILQSLDRFLNSDGLLEGLESWIFVEWSRANDFVMDVNYPTNMLYAAAKAAAGRLYGDHNLAQTARAMRKTILEQSDNGQFFLDHAVRREGRLIVQPDCTETCQYYAFFFGIATPQSHPQLWKRLTQEFGPARKKSGLYPEIYPSNAFFGHYLRLDLLDRYGLRDQLMQEITDFFGPMAEQTGTLWEHDTPTASLSHGFASAIAHWLTLFKEEERARALQNKAYD